MMTSPEWPWAITQTHERHSDRMFFMRPISYAMIRTVLWRANQDGNGTAGHALSLNISSKGLLILMDREPEVDQTMRISVPSAAQEVNIPTMADVRWARKVPFMSSEAHPFFFVGLRFML
jgi:hypothetical protein